MVRIVLDNFKDLVNLKINHPLLRQYFNIKNNFQDCIVLFQIGGFYETYFEDAKIFSQITGSILSSRSFKNVGEIPQAGIPKNALSLYIKKLISNNLKIVLCNQYKNENDEFERKVERIYTKGTLLEDEFLDSFENNYILALYDFNSFVELAYCDLSIGQFYKTKCEKNILPFELDKISPTEVLILKSQKENFDFVSKKYNVTYLKDDFLSSEIKENFSENLILEYSKITQKDLYSNPDKPLEYKVNNFLLMDETTRKNLELTRTKKLQKKKGSVFWFLNNTKTPMGTRFLKKILSEPLLDKNEIEKRLSLVDELVKNEKLLDEFEQVLKQFCDLSRAASKISNFSITPKTLYALCDSFLIFEKLINLSSKLNSDLFKINTFEFEKVLNFSNEIKTALNKDFLEKECDIINSNYNPKLDYILKKLDDFLEKIEKLSKNQKDFFKNKNVKISYSKILGYYIEIPKNLSSFIPSNYLKKQVLANSIRYTFNELSELESEIFKLKYQKQELEQEIFSSLKKKALDFVQTFKNVSKTIAYLDVIVSFARCALNNGFIKPTITLEDNLEIINGFHPSLLKLNTSIVKNDTILNNGTMLILTGANMSGKSTYLKQNAIINILAQIGSFVPCESAKIPILDKIFFFQGEVDDITNSNSSFMVEMNDFKFILNNLTPKSLLLLDEPAKSTNENEGGAIACAFLEYLVKNFKIKSIIATHNLKLTKLESYYPSKIFNISTSNGLNQKKITKGVAASSLALETAILADLPKEIIENAKKYLN